VRFRINNAESILAGELFSQMVNDLSASCFWELVHAAAVIAVVWFNNVGLLGDIDRPRIVPSTIISQEGLIDRDLLMGEWG